ncbi:hypothetical protein [Natronococcus occultus]|uniref:Amphi-Trp domain-containing protein n=1 Tax=Natronococcus occultus SP4 TaxID=694430 RepID=L0K1X0_9EURY|nr:hypothetical protein [Natronococcus occultus]AGB39001.1 hypothetical protein Natoc_3263 [Natronococcus occultus SP4]
MASLETTQERTRSEIAAYLREFADELDPETRTEDATRDGSTGTVGTDTTDSAGIGDTRTDDRDDDLLGTDDRDDEPVDTDGAHVGDKVTVIAGNESATINPPRTCAFDVAIDTDSDLLDTGAERSTSFTIRWDADHVEADDELTVE